MHSTASSTSRWLSSSRPCLLLLLLCLTVPISAAPNVTGLSGCVDYTGSDGFNRTGECRPSQLVTVHGGAFTSSSLLHVLGFNSTYVLPALTFVQPSFFTVRVPVAIDPQDVNVGLSVFATTGNATDGSRVLVGAVNLTGSPLQVTAVSGCIVQEGRRTSGCLSGQHVLVNGSGFSSTLRLSLYGELGGFCLVLNSTAARCPLPAYPQYGFAWLPVLLRSGGALSPVVSAVGVQYIPIPTVTIVTGCTTGQVLGCTAGTLLTVQGMAFIPTASINVISGNSTFLCPPVAFISSTTLTCFMPYLPSANQPAWLSIQVNNSYPAPSPLAGPSSPFYLQAVLYQPLPVSSTAAVRVASSTAPSPVTAILTTPFSTRGGSSSVRVSSSTGSSPTYPTPTRAASSSPRTSSSTGTSPAVPVGPTARASTAPVGVTSPRVLSPSSSSSSAAPVVLRPVISSFTGCSSSTFSSTFNCSYMTLLWLLGNYFGTNRTAVSLYLTDATGYSVPVNVTMVTATRIVFQSPSMPQSKWDVPFSPVLTVAGIAPASNASSAVVTFGAGATISQIRGCSARVFAPMSTFNCVPTTYVTVVGSNFGTNADVSIDYLRLLVPGQSFLSCTGLTKLSTTMLRCWLPVSFASFPDTAVTVNIPGANATAARTSNASVFFTTNPSTPVVLGVAGCPVDQWPAASGCSPGVTAVVHVDAISTVSSRVLVWLSTSQYGPWLLLRQVRLAQAQVSVQLPALNSSWYNVKLQLMVQSISLSNDTVSSLPKPFVIYTSPAPIVYSAFGCRVSSGGNATSSCSTSGGDWVTITGANFDLQTLRVWVGWQAVRSISQLTANSVLVRLPTPSSQSLWRTFLPVLVESRNLNASSAPNLIMFGDAPVPPAASPAATKWGMSVDEFVLVVVALVAVVLLLLVVQALWCLTTRGMVRLACVDRCCPSWAAAGRAGRAAGARGGRAEKDAIHLGLLQHDQLRVEQQHAEGQAGGYYRPYTPAAAAFAPPSHAQPVSQPAPAVVYQQWQPAQGYASAMGSQSSGMEGVPQAMLMAGQPMPILYPRSFVPSPIYYQ